MPRLIHSAHVIKRVTLQSYLVGGCLGHLACTPHLINQAELPVGPASPCPRLDPWITRTYHPLNRARQMGYLWEETGCYPKEPDILSAQMNHTDRTLYTLCRRG